MARRKPEALALNDVPERIEQLCGIRPSVALVRDWTKAGKLDSFRLGGRYYVPTTAITEFLGTRKKEESK